MWAVRFLGVTWLYFVLINAADVLAFPDERTFSRALAFGSYIALHSILWYGWIVIVLVLLVARKFSDTVRRGVVYCVGLTAIGLPFYSFFQDNGGLSQAAFNSRIAFGLMGHVICFGLLFLSAKWEVGRPVNHDKEIGVQ